MTWYARPSWQLVRQVTADVFVLLWTLGWWIVSDLAAKAVGALATPVESLGDQAASLQQQMDGASQALGQVPWVGDQIRGPFEQMSSSLGGMVATADAQAAGIRTVATYTHWIVFLAPVLLVVALWLPARLRFATRARQVKRLSRTEQGQQLLALRALANRPIEELLLADENPVGAWRAGNPEAIARLADVELAASGVMPPRGGRGVARVPPP